MRSREHPSGRTGPMNEHLGEDKLPPLKDEPMEEPSEECQQEEQKETENGA